MLHYIGNCSLATTSRFLINGILSICTILYNLTVISRGLTGQYTKEMVHAGFLRAYGLAMHALLLLLSSSSKAAIKSNLPKLENIWHESMNFSDMEKWFRHNKHFCCISPQPSEAFNVTSSQLTSQENHRDLNKKEGENNITDYTIAYSDVIMLY